MKQLLILILCALPLLSYAQTRQDPLITQGQATSMINAIGAVTSATTTVTTLPAGSTLTAAFTLVNGKLTLAIGWPISSTVSSGTTTGGSSGTTANATILSITGDGLAEGATTITDVARGHAVTRYGNLHATTTNPPTGQTSSLYDDGSTTYLSVADASTSDFNRGTGDVTIAISFRFDSFSSSYTSLIARTNAAGTQQGWQLTVKPNGAGIGFDYVTNPGSGNVYTPYGLSTTQQLVINTWYDFKYVIQSGVGKLYINNSLVATSTGTLPSLEVNSVIQGGPLLFGEFGTAGTSAKPTGRMAKIRYDNYPN